MGRESIRNHNALSKREVEVVQLLALGMTQQEAADMLGVACGTVKIHAAHILKNMGCANMPHAIYKAVSWGFIPPLEDLAEKAR